MFFTATFPYGIGEAWKRADVLLLSQHFKHICIQPLEGSPDDLKDGSWIPDNVVVQEPLFASSGLRLTWHGVLRGLRLSPWRVLRESLVAWRRGGRRAVVDVLVVAEKTVNVLQHPAVRKLLKSGNKRVLFYFYWGLGIATAIPFVDRGIAARSLVRFHGFDLYADRRQGHTPFQADLVERIAVAAPCSEFGMNYLKRLYPKLAASGRLCCIRVGTTTHGISPCSRDGVLRIVSSAFMNPVKRVWLLAEALRLVRCRVRWEHIGDGPDWERINELAHLMPVNVEAILLGRLTPENAHRHLANNSFDLFVNTSESEGVPVSIMESLSAGIPVLATDVGGTSEIVDDQVGRLVSKDVTAEQLARAIDEFSQLTSDQRQRIRKHAYSRFSERCEQSAIGRVLVATLSQLDKTVHRTVSPVETFGR